MASSVPSLIADARTFAQSFVTASTQASQQAIAAANNIGFTLLSYSGAAMPQPPTAPEDLTPQELQDIDALIHRARKSAGLPPLH